MGCLSRQNILERQENLLQVGDCAGFGSKRSDLRPVRYERDVHGDENIATASEQREFTHHDQEIIDQVKVAINEKIKVMCTDVLIACPSRLEWDIPGSFRCYNASYSTVISWFERLSAFDDV
jgi:hypothetical protein